MPVRAVCKPHSPELKKRRSNCCNLWRSLLERPPLAPESRVRYPLEARRSCGGVDLGGGVTHRYIFQRRSFEVSRSSSHETYSASCLLKSATFRCYSECTQINVESLQIRKTRAVDSIPRRGGKKANQNTFQKADTKTRGKGTLLTFCFWSRFLSRDVVVD